MSDDDRTKNHPKQAGRPGIGSIVGKRLTSLQNNELFLRQLISIQTDERNRWLSDSDRSGGKAIQMWEDGKGYGTD